MKRFLIFAAFLCWTAFSYAQVKVACIGDSVTYGYGLGDDRDSQSYPAQLQSLMGQGFDVRNFGHNGATLLRHGHRPYNTLPEYTAALEYAPDIAVIHLGLNDTDPRNWPNFSDEFIPDYRALIDDLRRVNPSVKIWICRLSPIFHGHPRFLSGTRDWHARIQEIIPVIAETAGTGLIDLHTPLFVRPDLFADNLHPSAEGYGIIAKTVYGAVTGDFGGLKLSCMYADNMVLQRGKPLVISGSADAGQQVEVTLAPEQAAPAKKSRKLQKPAPLAQASAVAASDGKWSVTLPATEAGGPYVLSIGDSTFHNVWLGEVWVCNGQSNMAFKLRSCFTAKEDIEAAASRSDIHLFKMTQRCFTDNVAWSQEDLDAVNRLDYFKTNGWETADAGHAADFSAIGYHFGRVLADSLGCHVGLIDCAVGGSTAESWCDGEVLRWDFPQILYNWNTGDLGQQWARERSAKNMEKSPNKLQRHPYQPCYLFDSAIRKIDRYQVKGLIWYQGESNAHNMEAHERLFDCAVRSWRQWWGEELPVEMIQLSGIASRPSWSHFRDSQRRLAETVPGVAMTVCSDLGNPTDVHPREKRTVGVRAASSALHYFYGMDVIPSGPVYRSMSREGNALRLNFDFADGLVAGKGFEIAGRDGLYHEAEAKVEGCTVVVRSDEVAEPCSVRFAWTSYPVDAVLLNSTGMPASTFRDTLK